MPWPMRIGPLPITSDGARPVIGSASFSCLVAGVEVRRLRVELGGAGVHHLVDGADVPSSSRCCAHLLRQAIRPARRSASSAKPMRFASRSSTAVSGSASSRRSMATMRPSRSKNQGSMAVRASEISAGRHVAAQMPPSAPTAARRSRRSGGSTPPSPSGHPRCQVGLSQSSERPRDLQRPHRLLHRRLEGPVDRHHLAGGLHLRAQRAVARRELVEGPARDLDHAVVQRRLERRRGLSR